MAHDLYNLNCLISTPLSNRFCFVSSIFLFLLSQCVVRVQCQDQTLNPESDRQWFNAEKVRFEEMIRCRDSLLFSL